ncbi:MULTISPECIES: gas vesicle protein [Actinomadura]|uniref:Gas vesicle protein n=1 Tax=Actinomadura miaoliensis TaxID=430685 RepID=A0ABP7V953_9ACTN
MTGVAVDTGPSGPPLERVALVDLLDRLLAGGVVLTGDLVISVAEVDLVEVSLRALITTVRDELTPPELAAREEQP